MKRFNLRFLIGQELNRLAFIFILCSVTVFLFTPPDQASAQDNCPDELEWNERRAGAYAILYPTELNDLSLVIADGLGDFINADYRKFQTLFQTELPFSASIRLYPNETYYTCLNTVSSQLVDDFFHAHVGTFEIAIIEDRYQASRASSRELLNAIRYETAVLFLQQVTDRDLPLGVEVGMGLYAQDPQVIYQSQSFINSAKRTELKSLRLLINSPSLLTDPVLRIQANSLVAYLIDVYGWAPFLDFLDRLPTSPGYRDALSAAYGLEMAQLEDQWRAYYPYYLDGRWRANIIHGFDLSAFEDLLAAGAYTDAITGLNEAIDFLQSIEDDPKILAAQRLLIQAKIGQEAGGLVRQARQALLDGEYEQTITLATAAHEKYQQIGDSRRSDELDTYLQRAQEVLVLRQELAKIQPNQTGIKNEQNAEHIRFIGGQLQVLGDQEGVSLAQTMLDTLAAVKAQEVQSFEADQQGRLNMLAIVSVSLASLLIIHRIWFVRRPRPSESQLI